MMKPYMMCLQAKWLPTYEKAVNEVKELEANIYRLKPLKSLLEKAIATYYEGLVLQKEALEQKDENLIEHSNAKGEEYMGILDEYRKEMNLLAEKYNIE
ncbi:hypothetical protein ACUXHY_000445 [Cytobacillus horneckiae]|uniref:hypothetical protein n=1 Tax=Cytobacillus horneckiae TaxID=549687 RepID=UPI0019D14C72|nr:hypothetical protein [Cytobacillus horneckiae]MBN6885308.1 hypothetical protein [Cytobacillus horneckiae]